MTNETDDIVSLAVLQIEVKRIEAKIDANIKSTTALVDAWNAAGTFVRFVRLVASIIAALGAIWLFIRHGWGSGN